MNELSQIKAYFEAEHIGQEEIAKGLGCSQGHIRNVFGGYYPLSDGMRFRFIQAYPGLMGIILLNDIPIQAKPSART